MSGTTNPLWKRVLRQPALTVMRGLEVAYASCYVTRPFQWLLAQRIGPPTRLDPPVRTALVAHVYYPELWDEIVSAWRALPAGSALIVTTPPERLATLSALRAGDPLIEIHATENRGRDVAPFITLLNQGHLDRFDAVLKLHTKKSPHLRQGDRRRRLFYVALSGHAANVGRILRLFSHPDVGMVGRGSFFRTAPVYWMGDKALVTDICARMTPPARVRLGFFEGTMFWVRPASLAPLRAMALTPADFDAEAGQLDGTLHHAIERCFTLAAATAGYQTRATDGRLLLAAHPAPEPASSAPPPILTVAASRS